MTIIRCTDCALQVEYLDGLDKVIESQCADCIKKEAERQSFAGRVEVIHIFPEEFI